MLRRGSPFVFKSHCWGHMAARTLVVVSVKCYRASNNALCFPFVCDPGLSGGPGVPQLFGGTSLGRSMKEILLFPSLTLSSLSSSQLMESSVQNTQPLVLGGVPLCTSLLISPSISFLALDNIYEVLIVRHAQAWSNTIQSNPQVSKVRTIIIPILR